MSRSISATLRCSRCCAPRSGNPRISLGTVQKMTDMQAIAARGVLATPAVAVDGKLVVQGKIPSVEQLKLLFTGA